MPPIMWNPWNSVRVGQDVEASQDEARRRGIAMRDDIALREAAALMGQGQYMTGFEGVEGAERPNYLRELFGKNPEAALRLEGALSQPFAIDREILKAGRIEEAKKEADAKVYNKLFERFMGSGTVPGVSAPATTPSPEAGGGGYPGSDPDLSGLSDVERGFKLGPQGPEFSVKQPSPFEKAIKARDSITASSAELRQTVQNAHDNVRRIQENILTTQKAMQSREIPWEEGRAQIENLKGQLSEATQRRDQLLKGGQAPASPAPAPAAAPSASAVRGATPAPKFTEKEQAGLDLKEREEKITAANKEIANARLGAEKVVKFRRQVGELYNLVTKQDIGHPAMEEVPGAATMLTMNRANAQVKKLAESIINMFAEPGQSQMMNTIIERQMQGAVVPNIFTDPQLNKINAAVLRSNVEHLASFPTFLELWQKSHKGTLDGAAEAWIDYTEHNPLYTYTKDPRGRVTTSENSHVVPLTQWMNLRATGGIRKIGDKVFVKQDDGSWVEK